MNIKIIKIENGYLVNINGTKYYQSGILEVINFLNLKVKDFFSCYYGLEKKDE